MGVGDHVYLIFVVIAFVAFALAGGIGIATYRLWRNRRNAGHSTPPGYPRR
jgi:hypothetical protein